MEALCHFYLGRVEETKSELALLGHDQAKSHYIDALRLFQTEGKHRLSQMSNSSAGLVDLDGKLLIELEAINLWAARALYQMASIHKVTSNNEDAISCYEEALRIRSQCKHTNKNGLNHARISEGAFV